MGLRVGEALALKNSDIDLKRRILSVNRTLTTDKMITFVLENQQRPMLKKENYLFPISYYLICWNKCMLHKITWMKCYS